MAASRSGDRDGAMSEMGSKADPPMCTLVYAAIRSLSEVALHRPKIGRRSAEARI
jgi:hypothetical protein